MNRFCATEIWGKAWYCALTPSYKLFFKYLCDNCNNAGIWDVNWPMVKFHIWEEKPLNPSIFGLREEDEKPRVIPLSESKWFIRTFVLYQQKIKSLSDLNPDNGAHKQIISILIKENILDANLSEIYKMPHLQPHQRGLGIGIGLDKGIVKKQPKSINFIPPTLEEVKSYFEELGTKINPIAFHAHYESNGWKQASGLPLRSWKSCLTTWEERRKEFVPQTPAQGPSKPPADMVALQGVALRWDDARIKTHMIEKGYTEHQVVESIMRVRGEKQ